MARPLGLAKLEELMFALVTARDGVTSGLAALGLAPASLAEWIRGDQRLDAVGRLDVYANMYFYRLLDVLRADYPKLCAVLGEPAFHNLVADYLEACPSGNPSVRHLGARLPGFLATHVFATGAPNLPDLARLEWARVEVFDRADAPVESRAGLAGLAPSQFARLALRLIPAHALVDVSFAVDDLWRRIEAGEESGETAAGRRRLLVWRKETAVFHRRLDEVETDLFRILEPGTSFGEVCERLGAIADPEVAAQRAGELLAGWLDGGLVMATASSLPRVPRGAVDAVG